MIRNFERMAIVLLLGAIVAYFAGLGVLRLGADGFAACTVAFVITVVALYLAWLWAGRERS
jgi:ABC-type branched-subunit amino acid transport system permease subunit